MKNDILSKFSGYGMLSWICFRSYIVTHYLFKLFSGPIYSGLTRSSNIRFFFFFLKSVPSDFWLLFFAFLTFSFGLMTASVAGVAAVLAIPSFIILRRLDGKPIKRLTVHEFFYMSVWMVISILIDLCCVSCQSYISKFRGAVQATIKRFIWCNHSFTQCERMIKNDTFVFVRCAFPGRGTRKSERKKRTLINIIKERQKLRRKERRRATYKTIILVPSLLQSLLFCLCAPLFAKRAPTISLLCVFILIHSE